MFFFPAVHTQFRVSDLEPTWDWSSTTFTCSRTPLKGNLGCLSSEQGTSSGCLEGGAFTVPCALAPPAAALCQTHQDVRCPQPVFKPSQAPTLPSASVFLSAGGESACKQGGSGVLRHSCLLQLHPMVFLLFTHLDATLLPSNHNSQCKEQASIQNSIP